MESVNVDCILTGTRLDTGKNVWMISCSMVIFLTGYFC